ncbi:MAG TPA: ABC transporter permease [Streptosporangiaceae bacterium]|nr:ABC transporter permease [Streptosporangiaceae bacterium]
MTRSRMRSADVIRAGASGLRFRRTRTLLSALGIAIGIAALVSVLGITKSSESSLLAEIDQLGTNLLTVTNGQDLSGGEAELPRYAATMTTRVAGVQQVAPTAIIGSVEVYRTDKVPRQDTGGLAVRAADPSLVITLGGSIREGAYLNAATSRFPVTVLGYQAAQTLGIGTLADNPQVRIGSEWFAVQGILNPLPLAPEIDRSALIGFPEAASSLGYDSHPSRIYVRTDVTRTAQVQQLLGAQANPEAPNEVAVSQPSDVLTARLAVVSSATELFLGLSAVVLLVGGIGIANVMIIAVLERRSEIGLRRALGATRAHIARQFLAESAVLSALGGTAGVLLGMGVTAGLSQLRHWSVIIPGYAICGGLAGAVAIGAVAGLYPAIRAARLSPTDALRTT